MSKIWFVTGASRGFGRQFVTVALSRGDRVAAGARDAGALEDLTAEFGDLVLPLTVDVTDDASVTAAVHAAHAHFGRLDIVVNNAGYGLFGAVEEVTEKDLREQLETNLFGVLRVTRAVLPILRAQGSGHIVQISSAGGIMAFPLLGGYHASKWALEGLSESLAQEVAGFGIAVTLVEPGGYATDWAGSSAAWAAPLPAYDGLREAVAAMELPQGDPAAAGQALLRVVDADTPPLRVIFGGQAQEFVRHVYADRIATWDAWSDVAVAAQG